MALWKFTVLGLVVLSLAVCQVPAQMVDDAGTLLNPGSGNGMDDPPGTKLKEFPFPHHLHGLTQIGDLLYGTFRVSSTQQEIYEIDPTTGAKRMTITLTGYPSGNWLYGLGWDVRRNAFILSETSTMGLALADLSGKVTTFVSTSPDRNVGAAYDTHRDGYWITSWNSGTLKLYDARNLPAVLKTIDLKAVGATRAAGTAYSPINDVVYTNSRNTKMGYVFDASSGKLLYSYPLVYKGANAGYGSVWYDRWQCPIVADYETRNVTYTDAGYPRADAANRVPFGKTLAINWKAGRSPSKFYKGAASLTERVAGITFFTRYFPVALDDLFFLSIRVPSIFQNFEGTLDTGGTALGAVNVPNAPTLIGFTFSIAWVTVDAAAPFGIDAISGPWQVGITK